MKSMVYPGGYEYHLHFVVFCRDFIAVDFADIF